MKKWSIVSDQIPQNRQQPFVLSCCRRNHPKQSVHNHLIFGMTNLFRAERGAKRLAGRIKVGQWKGASEQEGVMQRTGIKLWTTDPIDLFHCHATKKKIGNRPVEEAKKMKCYKRLIYKQFIQVSGFCGPQFLSYFPKRFTHLRSALYRDVILVDSFGAPIWPPEVDKNIFTFSLKALSCHRTRVRAHKQIF